MVAFFCPPPFLSARSRASATFVETKSEPADLATYSFTANLGSGPHCALVIYGRAASAARAVSSVTVDGAAAVQAVASLASGSGNSTYCGIYLASASGAGKNISVTWNGQMVRCAVDVFEVNGLLSTAPRYTATDTASPLTQSISCDAGGFILGGAATVGTGGWTWTALTKRSDFVLEANTGMSGACDNFSEAVVGRSVTASASFSQETVMALASFR